MLVKRVALVANRHDVAVPFSEGVVHLIDQRSQRAIRAVAEINAERIEAVAERARHAQQADRSAGKVDSRPDKLAFHLCTERRCGAVAVVLVLETEKIESIVGEQPQLPEISASSSRSIKNQRAR